MDTGVGGYVAGIFARSVQQLNAQPAGAVGRDYGRSGPVRHGTAKQG